MIVNILHLVALLLCLALRCHGNRHDRMLMMTGSDDDDDDDIPEIDVSAVLSYSSNSPSRLRRQVTYRKDKSVSDVVQKLLTNYNKEEPPSLVKPTEVQIGIYVISFYSINEQTMDYSVSMYLRQTWNDSRLRLEAGKDINELRLGDNKWNEIWIPDTFLRNEKAANFHLVTVENRMLKLKPSGLLWYVTKITATLACPMNLEKFPMDTQECPMLFESFGYTYDTMFFRPLERNITKSIDIAQDLQLPQFFIKNFSVINCDQNYTTGNPNVSPN